MLNSLTIDGFKIFRSFSLPRLSRLNLFVGSNNAGKSCLLEAIRLFNADANPTVLRDLIRSRDGDWEMNISRRKDSDIDLAAQVESPIRFLFNDFHCEGLPETSIQIRSGDVKSLRVTLAYYRTTRDEEGELRRTRVETQGPFEDAEQMVEISFGKDRRRVFSFDSFFSPRFPVRPFAIDEPAPQPLVSVGTKGITGNEIVHLWDRVSLTDSQQQIIDCLKLIEPRIEGLALIGDSGRANDRDRVPVIRLAGLTERFPLKSMGDGLTRLFHIALAMVNAPQGIVLIDEFENGIYWDIQRQLWPVLFRMATEFDVQLFVTTHSTDCVGSFVDAWKDFPELGTMYRLENRGGGAAAALLPMTNVADALAAEVELR